MAKGLSPLLFLVFAICSFAQTRKYEIRLGAGCDLLESFPRVPTSFNPNIGASFHFKISKKTWLGMDAQYEYFGSTAGKDDIFSLGLSGHTYLVKRLLYLVYGYRFGLDRYSYDPQYGYSQEPGTQRLHILQLGIGFNFPLKSRILPFIELDPCTYFTENVSWNSTFYLPDFYSVTQIRTGIMF